MAGGFFLSNQLTGQRLGTPIARQIEEPTAGVESASHEGRQPVIVVTPQQRHEIAQAFALHESVAGPLSWYAADDSNIRVAPAQSEERSQQPIAVVLRMGPSHSYENGEPKTYVIVCRGNDEAVLELPQPTIARTVRLRLLSTVANGQVSVRYSIAADGSGLRPEEAALVGRRHVGLGQTSLGQLALDDRLVDVDASAWVIQD